MGIQKTILMGLLATMMITGATTPAKAHNSFSSLDSSPFAFMSAGAMALNLLGVIPDSYFGHHSYERHDGGYSAGYNGWQQPQYLVPVPMPQTVYIAPGYYGYHEHHHHHRYHD